MCHLGGATIPETSRLKLYIYMYIFVRIHINFKLGTHSYKWRYSASGKALSFVVQGYGLNLYADPFHQVFFLKCGKLLEITLQRRIIELSPFRSEHTDKPTSQVMPIDEVMTTIICWMLAKLLKWIYFEN